VLAILDPWARRSSTRPNYAPVHLLLTAVELHIFADAPQGYHLVNVAIHALCALLLSAWLRRARLGFHAALAGGLFFLVHPANVEAVAWMSQLKTNASLAFSLGAILCWTRAPLAAALLFAASLFTKATGLFALPTVAALAWCEREPLSRAGGWLALWLAIAVLFAIPEFASFAHLGAVEVEAYEDPLVHLRSVAAVGARYLVMAVTGYGVSAFQEPEPAMSWLDPWWIASLPLFACWPHAGFAPWRAATSRACSGWRQPPRSRPCRRSSVLNPVADRYLYGILPGLIGGALCWGRDLVSRALGRCASGPARTAALRARGCVAGGLRRLVVLARRALAERDAPAARRGAPLSGGRHGALPARAQRRAARRRPRGAGLAPHRDDARIDRFPVLENDPGSRRSATSRSSAS